MFEQIFWYEIFLAIRQRQNALNLQREKGNDAVEVGGGGY